MAKLIGNAPNQVPTNADLGSMAFEDKKNYATTSSSIHQPYRNLIINGDMSIAQRATSVASITATGYYTADRFQTAISNLGTWTQSQSADVPTGQGFATSLKLDCTTADATPSANDVLILVQKFEGQNLQYLKKGTASAVSLTASFWVKSTKTGTFILELRDTDNGRTISKSYTVNTTNTWEKKTITFEGDTTGAFTNDNGNSLDLNFYLGAGTTYTSGTLQTTWGSIVNANRAVGQVNLADNTANDFYITGVQLEAGTTASDFEFLPYDVNLRRCQRYYYLHLDGSNQHLSLGAMYSSDYLVAEVSFPVKMRSQPSLVHTTGTDYYLFYRDSTSDAFNNWSQGIPRTTQNSANLETSLNVSGTAGHAGIIAGNNSASLIAFNSEL